MYAESSDCSVTAMMHIYVMCEIYMFEVTFGFPHIPMDVVVVTRTRNNVMKLCKKNLFLVWLSSNMW